MCPICAKHQGTGPLVGALIHIDDLVYVSHRAAGSLGYAFIETRRHAPYLDELTEAEAERVGWARRRLAQGFRAELAIDFVHAAVSGRGVAHFHEHVFVRHTGTPESVSWWQQWPDAPEGDVPALAARLATYFT